MLTFLLFFYLKAWSLLLGRTLLGLGFRDLGNWNFFLFDVDLGDDEVAVDVTLPVLRRPAWGKRANCLLSMLGLDHDHFSGLD